MLIVDELKKNDSHLRLVALALAVGLAILLAGLWWVQIVSAHAYQGHLETQSYRTIRLPAVRGKILDREGRVLAQNRPSYNLSLYLDDLRSQFKAAGDVEYASATNARARDIAAQEKQLGRPLTKAERKRFNFTSAQKEQFSEQARFRVASAAVAQIGQRLGQPLTLDPKEFKHDYDKRRAMPFTVVHDATPEQVARFEEQFSGNLGANVDLQSVREYPFGTLAGHLLGYLSFNDNSQEGEDAVFDYRLPDYSGVIGVEYGYDEALRGRAGAESVLVNNMGYRQSETILEAPEPGKNVVLTIDLDLQRAASASLALHQGANARGAVVVMDVRTGDVLAMVSSPEINPDYQANDSKFLSDPELTPEINRATQGGRIPDTPGSIFKPVVALAALEDGLDPDEKIYNPENPADPGHGYTKVGPRSIRDTALPGYYDLRRAIVRSSNTYFITVGLRTGIEKVVRLAKQFHFGERMNLPTRQETKEDFPKLERVKSSDWRDGDSANICFGQGEVTTTPMQMAVAYSAIANGGTVLWPRLVERIERQNPAGGGTVTNFPAGQVRDHIGVSARSLRILHDAMLGETEDQVEGTGRAAVVPGLRICGKTGTAQVKNEHGQLTSWNYWFASFAPYENPRYAVVVLVQSESKGSGGGICAPIAHDIYEAILAKEHPVAPKTMSRN
jgi:penicillin-binding protein 2